MTQQEWKKLITDACREAKTYKEFFDPVIDILAEILERKDRAIKAFESSGGNILVAHTNKGGATNIEKNPALVVINELNRDALAYWRELGLTPSAYKKMNADIKVEATGGLEKLLDKML